jgi:hypothetical protein
MLNNAYPKKGLRNEERKKGKHIEKGKERRGSTLLSPISRDN